MPVDVVCLSNATSRRIVTRPGAPAPRDAGHHAADGAAAQDQDVVDHEAQGVQPGRPARRAPRAPASSSTTIKPTATITPFQTAPGAGPMKPASVPATSSAAKVSNPWETG